MVPMHPQPKTGWIYEPDDQAFCHISGIGDPLQLQVEFRAGSESTFKQQKIKNFLVVFCVVLQRVNPKSFLFC